MNWLQLKILTVQRIRIDRRHKFFFIENALNCAIFREKSWNFYSQFSFDTFLHSFTIFLKKSFGVFFAKKSKENFLFETKVFYRNWGNFNQSELSWPSGGDWRYYFCFSLEWVFLWVEFVVWVSYSNSVRILMWFVIAHYKYF